MSTIFSIKEVTFLILAHGMDPNWLGLFPNFIPRESVIADSLHLHYL